MSLFPTSYWPRSRVGRSDTPPSRRPAQAVSEGGFRELPISFEHAEAVGGLPAHHRDPFDRIILAVAEVEGLTVVTSDPKFQPYGVPLIDALD